MWTEAHIVAEYEIDGPVVSITLTTPVGVVSILGEMTIVGDDLHIIRAHVGGLHPGALGRAGLNAIGRKLLEMPMSKKSSFREALERRGSARGESLGKSASPAVKLLLTARNITQPVDFARLLTRYGISLRKAHDVLDKLAFGRTVAVELSGQDGAALRSELSKLGVDASIIGPPEVDVKSVRERWGLSQSEFAARYPFELDTIQNWEQGRTHPDPISRTLLKVIEQNPAVVEGVLTKRTARKPSAGSRHKEVDE